MHGEAAIDAPASQGAAGARTVFESVSVFIVMRENHEPFQRRATPRGLPEPAQPSLGPAISLTPARTSLAATWA
jgi:hypothetical protein